MNWRSKLLNFSNLNNSGEELKGLIFDVQKFAIHDGGGIRTLVFLKGCPLKCAWCANPESIDAQQEITYIPNNCIHCGKCLEVCPRGAINLSMAASPSPSINRDRCSLCGECFKHCYAGALNIIGRYLSVAEVIAMVERDRRFYDQSNGGVTFSGGEPTAQPFFLKEVLKEAKKIGIHTAIETSGFVKWESFVSILKYVDLVLIDIKHMDSISHAKITGVPNELILNNIKKLSNLAMPVRIRLPLIPGHNDAMENMRRTAEFVKNLSNVQSIDILPYHRLGEMKWAQLGHCYNLENAAPPLPEHVQERAEIFRKLGLQVNIGG
jgi:pyruvate formate lyase activating enzyme